MSATQPTADNFKSRGDFIQLPFAVSAKWGMRNDRRFPSLLFSPIYHWRVAQLIDTVPDMPVLEGKWGQVWHTFSSELIQEWSWIIVVCALLLFTSNAMLQISGVAENPAASAFGKIAAICALNGILIGLVCMYTLYNVTSGIVWVQNAARLEASRWRNVPALLAASVVWLTWSILSLLALILAYVWRPAANVEVDSDGPRASWLVASLAVTAVLFIGVTHFVIIAWSLARMGLATEPSISADEAK
ncbi:hypothetical protein A0H81_10493 [Grifola frondosa]|uniref:Uncharacterized protein n=1 Tax=Grifola frondosa TaxID=5627 RepID=A0A1C7LZD2_GRIFR|nr:hypothetical protein A0H81_10493 [Grifola frondosa]